MGWGEILPLPGFSQETWEEAQTALLTWGWASRERGITRDAGRVGASCALAELTGALPGGGIRRAAPLCTGDPDDLVLRLADMPGEKIAKVVRGSLRSGTCDGMVVNLLLEAIPDLHLRLDAIAPDAAKSPTVRKVC